MNRLRVCTVFFAFTVAIAARADETNTPAPPFINAAPSGVTGNALPASIVIDGTTYEEVRWERVTPTTVTIFHKTGVATIPLEKLPPELQRRFGYDPVAVRQQLEKVEAEQRALAERKRREEAALPAPKRHLLRIGGIVYDFSELYTAMVEWHRWGSSTEESPQKERAKENFRGMRPAIFRLVHRGRRCSGNQ